MYHAPRLPLATHQTAWTRLWCALHAGAHGVRVSALRCDHLLLASRIGGRLCNRLWPPVTAHSEVSKTHRVSFSGDYTRKKTYLEIWYSIYERRSFKTFNLNVPQRALQSVHAWHPVPGPHIGSGTTPEKTEKKAEKGEKHSVFVRF